METHNQQSVSEEIAEIWLSHEVATAMIPGVLGRLMAIRATAMKRAACVKPAERQGWLEIASTIDAECAQIILRSTDHARRLARLGVGPWDEDVRH